MTLARLFRRDVLAAVAASLCAITKERVRTVASLEALAILCAELDCAPAIGKACLRALPRIDSKELLARLILSDIAPVDKSFDSARVLTQLVRERSRDDFRSERIIIVDSWIFSMTEARLYALAELLSHT